MTTYTPVHEGSSDLSDTSGPHGAAILNAGLGNGTASTVAAARRRAERERVRVSRACDRCKKKKIRCTGTKPCELCGRLGLDCQFNAKYTRGRVPVIEQRGTGAGAGAGASPLEYGMSPGGESKSRFGALPQLRPEMNGGTDAGNSAAGERSDGKKILAEEDTEMEVEVYSAADSENDSPAPSQTDLQDQYVGPSSGVEFLLRVQRRLHKVVSLSPRSSIFTFGDTPLPEFDSSFFVLPPKDAAKSLISRYFDFVIPTHRYLHRPSIDASLEELYSDLAVMRDRKEERGKRALLFMVFAQAQQYKPNVPREESDCSARYFQAAEHQLRAETGGIRLSSVQARLCQCFYLLSESRINHCWSLFGTTSHLLLALGIHRKRKQDPTRKYDLIDVECRKRVFWAAYTLDNYLSAALGRPRTFHDDDIDQEMPVLLADEEITPSRLVTPSSKNQSIMLAPIYHARLGKLMSGILKDLYGIHPLRADIRESLASKHHSELMQWHHGIANFLDVEVSLLNPLFQRQSNVLRLSFAHALILVHRPFLLSNFEDLSRPDSKPNSANPRTEKNVRECLKAAMSIVSIVNDLCEGGQMFRAFWFTQYYAFCAVVVLYVYTIQHPNTADPSWPRYFRAAQKCQSQISAIASEKDSFAQRYNIVLEELRSEAVKQGERRTTTTATLSSSSSGGGGNGEQGVDSDRDTEVVRTEAARMILRLSDNNPDGVDTTSATKMRNGGDDVLRNRNSNGVAATAGGAIRHQQRLQPQYTAFDAFQHPMAASTGLQYTQNMVPAGQTPFAGDTTGWGDFDSFVTSGVNAQEAEFFMGVDNMDEDGRGWFVGMGANGV